MLKTKKSNICINKWNWLYSLKKLRYKFINNKSPIDIYEIKERINRQIMY